MTPPDGGLLVRGDGVRFEWGLAGAVRLAATCAALVVVDVLSFSTAVAVVVGRDIRVHPCPWPGRAVDAEAARRDLRSYAGRVGAVVAVDRRAVTPEHPWSLSPAALARAPEVAALVLPSPNGSAICAAAGGREPGSAAGSRPGSEPGSGSRSAAGAGAGPTVVAACLRNATAVATWLLSEGYCTAARPVGVVAAGERWPDGSLRPAVEDLLGAALVLDGLATAPGGLSVDAEVARRALPPPGAGRTGDLAAAVRACRSGRELVDGGFGADVELAVARPRPDGVGPDGVVPVLCGGAFVSAALLSGAGPPGGPPASATA